MGKRALWIVTLVLIVAIPTLIQTIGQAQSNDDALTLVVAESFSSVSNPNWHLRDGWQIVPSDADYALQATNNTLISTYSPQTFDDVVVEATVQSRYITAELHLRQRDVSSYSLHLAPDGSVTLYRNDTVLGTATVSASGNNQWRTMRLSAIGRTIRASIDGVDVISTIDSSPLEDGFVGFAGKVSPQSINPQTLLVDDIRIWQPTPNNATASFQAITPYQVDQQSSGSLINGSFEDGLNGWTIMTGSDVEVRQAFGPNNELEPVEGDDMLFMSTETGTVDMASNGLPGLEEGSIVTQSFTMPIGATNLSFCYQFITNDYDPYEDYFLADLTYSSGTIILSNADIVGGVPASGVIEPTNVQGSSYLIDDDVTLVPEIAPIQITNETIIGEYYNSKLTQRVCAFYPVSSLAGESVTVRFVVADVDDTDVISAVVIDDVKVTTSISCSASNNAGIQAEGIVVQADNDDDTCPDPDTSIICTAHIAPNANNSNTFMRDMPNGSGGILASIPPNTQIDIIGVNNGWYYIEYQSILGWVYTSNIAFSNSNCNDDNGNKLPIPSLDEQGNELPPPLYDYPLPLPDNSWSPSGNLFCNDTEATRPDCSRILYHEFYNQYQENNDSPPNMSHLLATIFHNEFNTVADIELSILTLGNSYWAITYGSTCADDCLYLEEIINYLAGIQAWYREANFGRPRTSNLSTLFNGAVQGYSAATEILNNPYEGCTGQTPCHWGNYGLNEANYATVANNTSVLYCVTWQLFRDSTINGEGEVPQPSNPQVAPRIWTPSPDYWTDYRFVISTNSISPTSIYRYVITNSGQEFGIINNPLWFENRNGDLYFPDPQSHAEQITC